jgi:hypothetical protein
VWVGPAVSVAGSNKKKNSIRLMLDNALHLILPGHIPKSNTETFDVNCVYDVRVKIPSTIIKL